MPNDTVKNEVWVRFQFKKIIKVRKVQIRVNISNRFDDYFLQLSIKGIQYTLHNTNFKYYYYFLVFFQLFHLKNIFSAIFNVLQNFHSLIKLFISIIY